MLIRNHQKILLYIAPVPDLKCKALSLSPASTTFVCFSQSFSFIHSENSLLYLVFLEEMTDICEYANIRYFWRETQSWDTHTLRNNLFYSEIIKIRFWDLEGHLRIGTGIFLRWQSEKCNPDFYVKTLTKSHQTYGIYICGMAWKQSDLVSEVLFITVKT